MSDTPYPLNGTVTLSDANKPVADYTPARTATVVINYSARDVGELEALLDRSVHLAGTNVNRLLGRVSVAEGVAEVPGEAPAATRTRRTKAQIEADNAAKAPGATPSPSADPLAGLDDPTSGASQPTASPGNDTQPSGASDPLAGLDDFDVPAQPAQSPAAEISDDALNAAVQTKNGQLKDAPKIRTLIGTFNPDPTKAFQLRQIPAADRQHFLDQLEALV